MSYYESRQIRLKDLPDCLTKARYIHMVRNDMESVFVVAVLKGVKWFCAIGYPDVEAIKVRNPNISYLCRSIRYPQQIAKLGEKLPKKVADVLFPDWSIRPYSYPAHKSSSRS